MNRIKEFIIKYKAYIAVFVIAYLLGVGSGSDTVRTETKIVEKPVVETKEVQIVPDNIKSQLDACYKVIDLDAQALGVAANLSTTFSKVIPFIVAENVAEINKATNEINSYGDELEKLTKQKNAIIGICKS